MNTKEIAAIAEHGDDTAVRHILREYSLPLFMLREITERKDLSKPVIKSAWDEYQKRRSEFDKSEKG